MKKLSYIMALVVTMLTTGCNATTNKETNNNEETTMGKGKTLVVYFSHTGENYSVGNIKVGNTKIIADYISELTGADQFEIVAEKDYDMPYMQLIEVAKEEANKGELPAFKGEIANIDDYDTVFIGGPVWWGTYPQVVFTFFKTYDLNGKTLIPFTTHEGSGLASCVSDVKTAYPKATVKQGLAVRGSDAQAGKAKASVTRWLKDLGF